MYQPNIRDNTPRGHRRRATTSPRVADVEQRKTNEMIGAELGYRYVDSPVIADDPGVVPSICFANTSRRTWPGARLPHVWLDDGSALQDRIPATASRCCGSAAAGPIRPLSNGPSQRIGAPFAVLDIPDDDRTRYLWPRSPAAAAGPACRLARQRAAGRCCAARRDRNRTLTRSRRDSSSLTRQFHRLRPSATDQEARDRPRQHQNNGNQKYRGDRSDHEDVQAAVRQDQRLPQR